MDKYIAEFIGTFFLVLTIGFCAVAPGTGELTAIAVGSVLTAVIYAGGHISRAHYNPAITLAFWMRKRIDNKDVLPYLIVQFAAAAIAVLIVQFMKDCSAVTVSRAEILPASIAEFIFTFALAFVIMNVALAKKLEGNQFYGIAIATVVMAGIYAVGPISGAIFNPAVSLAACMMGLHSFQDIWWYWIIQFAGAAAASQVFHILMPDSQMVD